MHGRTRPGRQEDNSLVIEFFVAAVAIGVVACFGAPIGGVLFSIEVTSSHYLVSNLPKSFYCSLVGFVFVRAIGDQTIYPEVISLFQVRPLVCVCVCACARAISFCALRVRECYLSICVGRFCSLASCAHPPPAIPPLPRTSADTRSVDPV